MTGRAPEPRPELPASVAELHNARYLGEIGARAVRRIYAQGIAEGWWGPLQAFWALGLGMCVENYLKIRQELADWPPGRRVPAKLVAMEASARKMVRTLMVHLGALAEELEHLAPLRPDGMDQDIARLIE